MATLVVMYKTPKDPAAFDKYYVEKHIPLFPVSTPETN